MTKLNGLLLGVAVIGALALPASAQIGSVSKFDGAADGDFDYTDPGDENLILRKDTLTPLPSKRAYVAVGDFNLDGRPDIYHCNEQVSLGTYADRVYRNDGLTLPGINKAVFTPVDVPGNKGPRKSRRASVADLNLDGRPDVIVMAWSRRPKILRNTSVVGGAISFVDWTPGNTFPAGATTNQGFHAVAFVSDTVDSYPDIFLASRFEGDYFFENTGGLQVEEPFIHGEFSAKILDEDPISVKGTFSADPQTDVCVTDPLETFVPSGDDIITVSVVFTPPNTCTMVRLVVEQKISGSWIEKANVPREPPIEIALQFDEVSADQFRFTMIGTGCQSTDPYYLEVLARTDNP